MDPNAAIKDIVNALRAENFSLAKERAISLNGWIDGGGFLPSFPPVFTEILIDGRSVGGLTNEFCWSLRWRNGPEKDFPSEYWYPENDPHDDLGCLRALPFILTDLLALAGDEE